MNHPTLQRAISIAETRGCKAQTPKGLIKFFLGSNLFIDQRKLNLVKRANPEIYRIHKILDTGKKGDICKMPADKISNFRRFSFVDNTVASGAKRQAHINNPRKKNLFLGLPKISGFAMEEREETFSYGGRFRSRKGSNIYADYQSCICLSKTGKLAVIVTGNVIARRILAPKGMLFDKDNNGIKLIRISDKMDYHPIYGDWRAKDFATRVRRQMAANYKNRVESKRLERKNKQFDFLFNRDLHNTMVTLDDSRKAGNCIQGSLNFAEKKLRISGEDLINGGYLFTIPASKILKVANGDTARAMAACRTAWLRETEVAI